MFVSMMNVYKSVSLQALALAKSTKPNQISIIKEIHDIATILLPQSDITLPKSIQFRIPWKYLERLCSILVLHSKKIC